MNTFWHGMFAMIDGYWLAFTNYRVQMHQFTRITMTSLNISFTGQKKIECVYNCRDDNGKKFFMRAAEIGAYKTLNCHRGIATRNHGGSPDLCLSKSGLLQPIKPLMLILDSQHHEQGSLIGAP